MKYCFNEIATLNRNKRFPEQTIERNLAKEPVAYFSTAVVTSVATSAAASVCPVLFHWKLIRIDSCHAIGNVCECVVPSILLLFAEIRYAMRLAMKAQCFVTIHKLSYVPGKVSWCL